MNIRNYTTLIIAFLLITSSFAYAQQFQQENKIEPIVPPSLILLSEPTKTPTDVFHDLFDVVTTSLPPRALQRKKLLNQPTIIRRSGSKEIERAFSINKDIGNKKPTEVAREIIIAEISIPSDKPQIEWKERQREVVNEELIPDIKKRVDHPQSLFVNLLTRIGIRIGAIDKKFPSIISITPNPLDFNDPARCPKNLEETCEIHISMKNTKGPYEGKEDNSFSYFEAQFLEANGWGEKTPVIYWKESSPGAARFTVPSTRSLKYRMFVINYEHGDKIISKPYEGSINALYSDEQPTIKGVIPLNPIIFDVNIFPNANGDYPIEITVENLLPEKISNNVPYSAIVAEIEGYDPFVLPFTYVDEDTAIVYVKKITGSAGGISTVYTYIDQEHILVSNSYKIFMTATSDPVIYSVAPNPLVFDQNILPDENGDYTVEIEVENAKPPKESADDTDYGLLVATFLDGNTQVVAYTLDPEVDPITGHQKIYVVTKKIAPATITINLYSIENGYHLSSNDYPVIVSSSDGGTPPELEIGLPVDLTLTRVYPTKFHGPSVSDFASPESGEYLRFGIPISQLSLITTDSKNHASLTLIRNDGNSYPYQIHTTSSWPGYSGEYAGPYFSGSEGTEYARWVVVETLADHSGSQQENMFTLAAGGAGVSSGSNICQETATHIIINTGKIEAKIAKSFSTGLEEVSLLDGGSPLKVIDSTKLATPGIVVTDKPTGNVYSSLSGDVEITRNGPVSCRLTARGPLTSGSQYYMDYALRFLFVKDSSDIDLDMTMENDVPSINFNREYDSVEFLVGVDGTGGQVTLSNANNENSPLVTSLNTPDVAYSHYGSISADVEAGYGWVPYINNYQGYVAAKDAGGSVTTLQNTQNENIYPRYFTMAYSPSSSAAYVAVSAVDAPGNNWPVGFKADGAGILSFQFYADEVPSSSKAYHQEYGSHRTKEARFHVGKLAAVGGSLQSAHTDMITRLKADMFPLFSFASDYSYYRKTGGFAGYDGSILLQNTFAPLETPITLAEQQVIDQKIANTLGPVPMYNGLMSNTKMRSAWQWWNNQPGAGDVTNAHTLNLFLMMMRTGDTNQFPGGPFLSYGNVAKYWADTGAVHNSGLKYGDPGYGDHAQNPHQGPHSNNLEAGHFQDQFIIQYSRFLGDERLEEAYVAAQEWNKAQYYWNGGYLRGFARLLRSLSYGYLEYGDPSHLQHIQSRIPGTIYKRTRFYEASYGGNVWSALERGWLCDPGQSGFNGQGYDIEELENQGDVDQYVDKATTPACGYFDGQVYGNVCKQTHNRPWQEAELGQGLKIAGYILPSGQLKDDVIKRAYDTGRYLNNDNVDDAVDLNYDSPENSGPFYTHCFDIDNPPGTSTDYDVIVTPFLAAYEYTHNPEWLTKGLMWYMVQARSDGSYGNPGSGTIQGFLYSVDKTGYFEN